MITRFVLLGLLPLAGCVTLDADPPRLTTVQVCSIVQQYTPEEQRALAAELRRGVGPLTNRVLGEWVSLRDQAYQCQRRNKR